MEFYELTPINYYIVLDFPNGNEINIIYEKNPSYKNRDIETLAIGSDLGKTSTNH